jgi:hypothetical protein
MELRFVARFVKSGVKLQIMAEARDVLRHPHPFATKEVVFKNRRPKDCCRYRTAKRVQSDL